MNVLDGVRKLIGPPATQATDIILEYWKGREAARLPRPSIIECATLSSVTAGLGDTLMLTDLPRASAGKRTCHSSSPHFRQLIKYNPHWREPTEEERLHLINAPSLVTDYDSGNGHYLQRIRRGFGLPVSDVPKGCIAWKGKRNPNRVILHFDPGIHVQWQLQHIHPKARMLYPEARIELERFISQRGDLEFFLVGNPPEGRPIKGATQYRTKNTLDLIEFMGSASWFIGTVSGPMHLATAMDIKCVVFVNIPGPQDLILPTLKPVKEKHNESAWLYPQNVHLHLDGAGPLSPKVSCQSLRASFDGEVYPCWSKRYCGLIRGVIDDSIDPRPTDYSQWGEQKIILEYFRNTPGTFIDLGAFDGVTGSNTRALYERGWAGVCVEAHASAFNRLASHYRNEPRISCVNAAIATPKTGPLVKFIDAGDQISTAYQEHRVKQYKRGEWHVGNVSASDLAKTFGDNYDFVSLDIEGLELAVIPTLGPLLKTTQLVCTEDTIPNCPFDQSYYDQLLSAWAVHGFTKVVGRTYALSDDKPSNTLLART